MSRERQKGLSVSLFGLSNGLSLKSETLQEKSESGLHHIVARLHHRYFDRLMKWNEAANHCNNQYNHQHITQNFLDTQQ
ncbi:hypothetical protein [uncultured Bacteroides sp.]|uniref:hypothetical protein n=1 Tax=uncultured Bacteroides sp. TaxID=162156 RepID=UPI0025FCB680|nr:hypothetical protein [uncultured Bacteroides sp.]